MSAAKHTLSFSLESDYTLLGILSDEPGYRLCWQINRALKTDFRREDNLLLYHKKLKVDQQIEYFSYHKAHSSYRLIKNACEPGFFLDEMKNLDYFMHLEGDSPEKEIRELMNKLQTLSCIRMCVRIDKDELKSGERFLLW
ncbi:MAG: hypothetical protein CSA96_05000 [Bacteroidetes bacterium]|nr:MAG: hypothetical protein CSA96_05000 [Bacteroidota bacterium]